MTDAFSAKRIVLGAIVLALGYLPTLFAPFDFIDDGNLVYPAPPGLGLAGHAELWWAKVMANVEHLGPFRPVLIAHWEVMANTTNGDPFAWRAVRLVWCGLAAGMLLWLLRVLKAHPTAALLAAAAAMWNPYRNEIWTSLTLAEGVAMPYALLALVAARKAGASRRLWVWDVVSILCVLAALGCKNTFAALVPAQLALRLWPDGVTWRDGLRRNWARAALYLLPLILPVAHYKYFKDHWHEGQYEMPGPTLAQAGRLASWLKGAAGLDFLGVGIVVALLVLGLYARKQSPRTAVRGLSAQYRAPLLAGALLLLAGFAVYLPLPMVAARYTMPAVWGFDILFALLLTALAAIPVTPTQRLAWGTLAAGVAVLFAANIGRQGKVAARSRLLWDVVHHVEQTAPPNARIAWVGGDTAAGALNPEEGIHFRWHLYHRGRPDVRIGLLDEAGNPIPRIELPPLDGPPQYRVTMGPEAPEKWEPVREFTAAYWLGRKQFRCRLDAAKP